MFNIYLAGSYQFDFENIPKSDIGIFSNRLISYEHPARERDLKIIIGSKKELEDEYRKTTEEFQFILGI